jgi:hypothetical protein
MELSKNSSFCPLFSLTIIENITELRGIFFGKAWYQKERSHCEVWLIIFADQRKEMALAFMVLNNLTSVFSVNWWNLLKGDGMWQKTTTRKKLLVVCSS